MAATILLITDPPEADRLGRTLTRIWGRDLRLLADPQDPVSPEEQLQRARPDVLIIGAGSLGVPLTSYVQAARRLCPACVVVLLCDPPFAATAKGLHPDRLLIRPLTGAAVQGVLAELAKGLRDAERRAPGDARALSGGPATGAAPLAPAPVATLERLDDLFADPLAPPRELPRPQPRAGNRAESGYAPRRARSAS